MSLTNKRILITAGPTWVAIDSVRVISNTASGETGILLAKRLSDAGAKVTLLLGPVNNCCLDKRIKVIRFKFFDQLKQLVIQELKSRAFDWVIHSAAVSDYQPRIKNQGKIKSGLKVLRISLKPTAKIIDLFKKLDPRVQVAGFKFEPDTSKRLLIQEAKQLILRAKLDLVIANTTINGKYQAYILGKDYRSGVFSSKNALTLKLTKVIEALR